MTSNLIDKLSKLEARIADLEAKLETANALVTCCCGSLVNDHDMGSGHSPVDQYHYAMVQIEADNKRLREALENLVERFSYYAELAKDGVPNIEDWAYTEGSSDIAKARAALGENKS